MTKGAAKGKKDSLANKARREALQVEKKQLIKQGLLPRPRTIPGYHRTHRGRIDRFIETEIVIKGNREKWIVEHPEVSPPYPWEKFNMG